MSKKITKNKNNNTRERENHNKKRVKNGKDNYHPWCVLFNKKKIISVIECDCMQCIVATKLTKVQ